MTRTDNGKPPQRERNAMVRKARAGRWILQDAKARFSELVRRARREGPQLVTVHGHEEVVVLSIEEFRRLMGNRSGQLLVDVLRDSPLRDVPLETQASRPPVRRVKL